MATQAQLETWLSEAETALHKLSVGSQTVEVKKPDGGSAKFTPATVVDLRAYIRDIKSQIAAAVGKPARGAIRPMF